VDGDEAGRGGEDGVAASGGFTRRAVLGAAVAVPVAATASSSRGAQRRGDPVVDCRASLAMTEKQRRWELVLAAYREADAARAKFEAATCAASVGPEGRSFDEQEALDDEYGVFVGVADSAMLALLEARAPDLDALVVKISLISEHRVWENDGGEDCLAWLEADARRLAEGSKAQGGLRTIRPVGHIP
jgi:hypothetical protein